MSSPGDQLLYAMSVWGGCSWAKYKRATAELLRPHAGTFGDGRPGWGYQQLRARRILSELGHAEFDFEGAGSAQVCAPLLARLPVAGLPTAVACGGRSAELVPALRAAADRVPAGDVEVRSQSPGAGWSPSRIRVRAGSVESLAHVAEEVGIGLEPIPPAWQLSAMSVTVDEVRAALRWDRDVGLDWEAEHFDPMRRKFVPAQPQTPVCLTRYLDPHTTGRVFFLRKDGQRARVGGHWGRYVVMAECRIPPAYYDARVGVFIVAATTPLPCLIARALTLCSGEAARWSINAPVDSLVVKGGAAGFLSYVHVPSDVATTIRNKLELGEPLGGRA